MHGSRIAQRWVAAAALAAIVVSSAPMQPSPAPGSSSTTAAIASQGSSPTASPGPSASRAASLLPDPSRIALVPVVGFWSTRTSISTGQLGAALARTSGAFRRVLVAGALPGATPSTPSAIRKAVNADPRTLGLLPASQVTPDVRALAMNGHDLFGNQRLRDIDTWPLFVSTPSGTGPPAFDPATTWTMVAGGDVMLDRSIYQRTILQHKGADYPWKGGFAKITGRRCCTSAGGRLPIVRRTGHAGALRSLFHDADLALVNLEGPAVTAFRWHPRGLTFTFDPVLLAGLRHAGIDVVTIANNHIGNAGPAGVLDTIRHLDAMHIAHVGAGRTATAARAPATFEIAGQQVALLGYDAIRPAYHATARRAGSAGLDRARYRTDLAAARRSGADVVVVLPHWGVEYTAAPTSSQRANARALVAAGTTLILGSHSHYAGAMESVGDSPVLYSMGNLVFDLTRSEETVEGIIVEITFVGGRPAQIRLHPTVMVDLVQPNLLDPAGDGKVVIERMRKASLALTRR